MRDFKDLRPHPSRFGEAAACEGDVSAGARRSAGTGRGKGKLAAILALTLLSVFTSAGSMVLADNGGYAAGDNYYGSNPSNNSVTITGSYTNVYGGYAESGDANGNTVTISGGTISGNVYGGYVTSGNGDAFTNNTLVVSSTDATAAIAGSVVYNFATIELVGTTDGQTRYSFNVSLDNPGTEDTYTTTLSVETGNVRLSGDISDGENSTLDIIIKSGNGTLSLDGDNTYSGTTTIQAGTLELVEDQAFSNGAYVIYENATLRLNVADEEDLPVGVFTNDVSGAGILDVEITNATMVLSGDHSGHTGTTSVTIPDPYTNATLRLASQQSVSGGNYVLDDGTTLELAFEGSFGQDITGGNDTSLSIDSTGEVRLTVAQNNFSGNTVVTSGTLRLEDVYAAGTSTAPISMADGTTLVLAYSGDFTRGITITETGVVNLVADAASTSATGGTASSGEITLKADMADISGMVTVLSGSLNAGTNALASTSGLTLYSGASITPASTYSLSGKVLNVVGTGTGESATFNGNLNAVGATINYAALAQDSGTPALMVTGYANISNSVNTLNWVDGVTPGESIQILSATEGITYDGATVSSYSQGLLVYQGALDLLVDENGNSVMVVTYEEPTTRGEAKALLEGSLAAATLVTQGADMVAGRGMEAARNATKNAQALTFTPFAAVQGGSMRYNSGSHIDTRSLNLMAGLAVGANSSAGEFTLGAFFEYGTGSYNTHNSFDTGHYDGNGDAYFVGWGLLGRWDALKTGPGHFYVEASGRMGGLYNSYENDDLRRGGLDQKSDYDRYNAYYGFHAGLGYVFDFAEAAHLDVYGKYFWTRVNGESVSLSDQTIHFEDFTSSRLRLGTRFSYDVNEQVKPYIGAAWEHEFDGKVSGSVRIDGYGADIASPSLRGDTGIGELGISLTPSESVPFTLDVAVQGYVGKREGVTGSVHAKYAF